MPTRRPRRCSRSARSDGAARSGSPGGTPAASRPPVGGRRSRAPRARPPDAGRRSGGVDRESPVAGRSDPDGDRHRDLPLVVAAVAERMRSLDAVIADLYGPRTLVADRIVPGEVLASTDRYRVNAVGASPRRWLTTYAVDLALGADGVWCVVQDLTDAPPGIGYALLDRSVMSRVVPDVMATARDRLDRPLHGVDAPCVGGDLTGREPADRRVLGRARPPVVRRSLLPGGATRRAPGRRRRPGRATAAGVAAHARRARTGRRPVPEVGRPDGRPARGRCSRRARRSRPAAGGQVGRRRTRQRPRGRGGGGARRVGLRRRRDRAAAPDGAVAPASARPVGTVGDGRRPRPQPGLPGGRGGCRAAVVRRRRRGQRRRAAGRNRPGAGAGRRSAASDGVRRQGRVGARAHAGADRRAAPAAGRLRTVVAHPRRRRAVLGQSLCGAGGGDGAHALASSPRGSSRTPAWH